MPPKIKSKNAPNHHDKRHETGLAPPGKRVTKQRSTGQLNGPANGKPAPSSSSSAAAVSPPPALPTTGLNQTFRFPRLGDDPSHCDPAAAATATRDDVASTPEDLDRGRFPSDISLEDNDVYAEMGEIGHQHEQAAVAPNVEFHGTARKLSAPTPLSRVPTILTNYPLRDAISILILLLSLPPTLVLVIQTLFASLTFVPPTAGLSLTTLPNIREMFNSAGMGYPAMATILIVDILFWICWLPVWTPVQGMFLDLSQAVIAVSLSGAAAGNGRPTYSIATTSVIVCVVHVLRYKAIHLTALDYLRSVIHKAGVGTPIDVPSFAANYFSSSPMERGWMYTVVRTILGIHIVSQGVTTCIRRSLVKANEQNATTPATSRSDPESSAGGETMSRSNTGHGEASQHHGLAVPPESRSPGPSPIHRDSKPRESSGKKKRKQANQVRSQQPLWAAVASTKVTFIKEMEQRDAADDARVATKMDTNTNRSASINSDCLWICEVRDTEILFSVDISSETKAENGQDAEAGTTPGTGIDKSKPFYVRINGAAWSSTRIAAHVDEDESDTGESGRYEGEIFGLAPLSSYHCEIVATMSGKVVGEGSIITQPAPSADLATTATSQPTQTLRPSSPITTLRQSIQSAEARLNETRNRGKKSKKDQRAIHSDIKREVNMLRSKLDPAGGTDDKQERRLVQITQHKNQAEEATAELKEQIEGLGEIPEHEIAESDAQRRVWQAALNAKNAAQTELDVARAEAEREHDSLKSDIYQAESKREKLLARHAQRTQEKEKLVSKQHADMSAKQRRDFERAQATQAREHEEQQLRFHINNFEAESQSYQQKAHDAYQQIATLQSWPSQQQLQQPPPYPGYSSPPTPENPIATLNSTMTSPPVSNGFPAFVPQPFNVSPFSTASAIAPPPPGAPRARSSSMLSQYSGFTDNGEDFFVAEPRSQHSWPSQATTHVGPGGLTDERNASEGSGSLTGGSTGSNSPRPDAKIFVPGKAPPSVGAGPLGYASRNGKEKAPQSPLQASATVDQLDHR